MWAQPIGAAAVTLSRGTQRKGEKWRETRSHQDQLTLQGAWPLSGWVLRTMGCLLLAMGG